MQPKLQCVVISTKSFPGKALRAGGGTSLLDEFFSLLTGYPLIDTFSAKNPGSSLPQI